VVTELRSSAVDKEAQLEVLREQLADANRRLRLASQPHGYLAEQLQLAEAQLHAQQQRVDAALAERATREEALARSQQQQRILKADLERVLQQRGSLDALRSTLSKLL